MKPSIKNSPLVPERAYNESVVVFHDKLLLHQTRLIHKMIYEGEELPDQWADHRVSLCIYGLFHFAEVNQRVNRELLDLEEETKWELSAFHVQMQHKYMDLRQMKMRRNIPAPPWMESKDLHESHREWLLFKNPRHYGEVWPDMFEPMEAPEVLWT